MEADLGRQRHGSRGSRSDLATPSQATLSAPLPAWSEADFAHPVFDPIRSQLDRLAQPHWPGRDLLNALAESADLRTRSGHRLRFVPPEATDPCYEVNVHATGRVQTRAQNWHDLFNALVWLAFPRTKARINAMHAAEIPREAGKRGRLRDMLTLFDEGGAIVACADAELQQMIRAHRWQDLFWRERSRARSALRVHVLGHAVLEMALRPWPGVTCKVIFVEPGGNPDEQAERWLIGRTGHGTTKDLVSLPIYGLPGWYPGSDCPEFYADERYFRPFRKTAKGAENVVCP